MGFYAVVHAAVRCPTCESLCDRHWQFYFGQVGDLPVYEVGDRIRWNSAPCFGSREMEQVVAVGYLAEEEFCERCRLAYALADVLIFGGCITEVRFRSFEPWIEPLFFLGPELTAYSAAGPIQ